ncbi:hypothetical protein ACSQ67_019044 [Phaseolus vulgaris]
MSLPFCTRSWPLIVAATSASHTAATSTEPPRCRPWTTAQREPIARTPAREPPRENPPCERYANHRAALATVLREPPCYLTPLGCVHLRRRP